MRRRIDTVLARKGRSRDEPRYDQKVIDFALQCFREGYGLKHTTQRVNEQFKAKISPTAIRQWYYKFFNTDQEYTTDTREDKQGKHPKLSGKKFPPPIIKRALELMDAGLTNSQITKIVSEEFSYPLSVSTVPHWRKSYRPEMITPFYSRHIKCKPEVLAYGLHLYDTSNLISRREIVEEVNRKFPDSNLTVAGLYQFLLRMRPNVKQKERAKKIRWSSRKCAGCGTKHSKRYLNNRGEEYEIWNRYNGAMYCSKCSGRIKYNVKKNPDIQFTEQDIIGICTIDYYVANKYRKKANN